MLVIHRDIEQGTDEWHAIRRGKLTGSKAQAIANAGKGLNTICNKIAFELFTGKQSKAYKNDAMARGNELEKIARIAYECETRCKVEQVGFGELSEWVGSSPDGLVGDDGGVEFKSREHSDTTYSEMHGALVLGEGGFESAYIWQCHYNMYVFGRKWWDLVSYDPSFKSKALYIERIERDDGKIEQIEAGVKVGIELIKAKLKKLTDE